MTATSVADIAETRKAVLRHAQQLLGEAEKLADEGRTGEAYWHTLAALDELAKLPRLARLALEQVLDRSDDWRTLGDNLPGSPDPDTPCAAMVRVWPADPDSRAQEALALMECLRERLDYVSAIEVATRARMHDIARGPEGHAVAAALDRLAGASEAAKDAAVAQWLWFVSGISAA